MHEETLAVLVWRGGADGAFREGRVPRRPAQTVLDVAAGAGFATACAPLFALTLGT